MRHETRLQREFGRFVLRDLDERFGIAAWWKTESARAHQPRAIGRFDQALERSDCRGLRSLSQQSIPGAVKIARSQMQHVQTFIAR
jgi:hypothetical protein